MSGVLTLLILQEDDDEVHTEQDDSGDMPTMKRRLQKVGKVV